MQTARLVKRVTVSEATPTRKPLPTTLQQKVTCAVTAWLQEFQDQKDEQLRRNAEIRARWTKQQS